MGNNPILSVVVPMYGVEKYITRCLDSIRLQTFRDIEVLIVNDGTKDNSRVISQEYIEKYHLEEQFRIYDKENGGLSDARNFGMQRAKGQYICFLDADDYLAPTAYEQMMAPLLADDRAVLVQCGYYMYYSDRKMYGCPCDSFESVGALCAYGYVMAWNKIYRKAFLDQYEITFPKNLYYEDVCFFYRALSHISDINAIKTVRDPLVYYVQRPESISNCQTAKNIDILSIYELLIGECTGLGEELEYRCSRNLHASFFNKAKKIRNKSDRDRVLHSYALFLKKHFPEWKKNRYYRFSHPSDLYIRLVRSKMLGRYK